MVQPNHYIFIVLRSSGVERVSFSPVLPLCYKHPILFLPDTTFSRPQWQNAAPNSFPSGSKSTLLYLLCDAAAGTLKIAFQTALVRESNGRLEDRRRGGRKKLLSSFCLFCSVLSQQRHFHRKWVPASSFSWHSQNKPGFISLEALPPPGLMPLPQISEPQRFGVPLPRS